MIIYSKYDILYKRKIQIQEVKSDVLSFNKILVFSQPGIIENEIVYYINNCTKGEYVKENLNDVLNTSVTYELSMNTLYKDLYNLKALWKTDSQSILHIIQYMDNQFVQYKQFNRTFSVPKDLNIYRNFVENLNMNIDDWIFQCYFYNLQCIFVSIEDFNKSKNIPALGYYGCDREYNIKPIPISPFKYLPYIPDIPKSEIFNGKPPFSGSKYLVFSSVRTGSTALVDILNNCIGDSILELGHDFKVNTQKEFNFYMNDNKTYKIQTKQFYSLQDYLINYITQETFIKDDWIIIYNERQNKLSQYVSSAALKPIKQEYHDMMKFHTLTPEKKEELEIEASLNDYKEFFKTHLLYYKRDVKSFCKNYNLNCIILQYEDFIKTKTIPGIDKTWDCITKFIG